MEALPASRVLWVYCESQKENECHLAVLTPSESRPIVRLLMSEVTAEKMTKKKRKGIYVRL